MARKYVRSNEIPELTSKVKSDAKARSRKDIAKNWMRNRQSESFGLVPSLSFFFAKLSDFATLRQTYDTLLFY